MKTMLFLWLTLLFSSAEVSAKGYCDMCWDESCPYFKVCQDMYNFPVFEFTPIKEGTQLRCSDGPFHLDLVFEEKTSSTFRGANYKVSGYGVYGPRLSGVPFVSNLSVSQLYTRLGEEQVIRGEIKELKGSLTLRQKTGYVFGNEKLSGTVSVFEKTYKLSCEEF